jgi:hypothetical protein
MVGSGNHGLRGCSKHNKQSSQVEKNIGGSKGFEGPVRLLGHIQVV